MEIKKANELDFDPREQMSRIFVEGFYDVAFKGISKDKNKLVEAFKDIFDLAHFYVGIENGKIATFVGVSDRRERINKLDKKAMRQQFGFLIGTLAYIGLKKEMLDKPYPFEMAKSSGSIDFVSASPEFYGRGFTYQLIDHVIKTENYETYVLEVADPNPAAQNLYKKLGFKEFKRVPTKHAKRSGIDNLIYMERKK